MKKIIVLVLIALMLVGCNSNSLEKKMSGEWLLVERHMVIEFTTEEDNYVEFKDSFELEGQMQTRHIKYNPEDEFELESERQNGTSFYTQTFTSETAAIENLPKTENTYYLVTYGEDEIFYEIDESKTQKKYVDVYEQNGFSNKVSFDGKNLVLTLELDAEDFGDDPGYATVKSIVATMVLRPFEGREE
jgi:hypothetical protein